MSYTQGTVVRLSAELRNADDNELIDGAAIVLRVRAPSGTITEYDDTELMHDDTGLYHYDLDTEPEHGHWHYEWDSGGETAVVKRTLMTVHPRIDEV